MTKIELTYSEVRIAAEVGVQRQARNIRKQRRQTYRHDPEDGGWGAHIEAACAEMAVAKSLGIYWNGALDNFEAADVGPYQVRSTKHRDGCLLLHSEDRDADKFILIVGMAPHFEIKGWIRAGDGKRNEYWQEKVRGRPAYFVPQGILLPMEIFANDAHQSADQGSQERGNRIAAS